MPRISHSLSTTPPRSDLDTADHPLLTRAFIRLLIGQAGFGYAFSSFFLIPKYLAAEFGTGPAAIGALTAAHSAAAMISLLAAGVLVDRYGRRPFLTAGAVLMAICSLGFLAVDGLGPLIYALRIGQGVAFAMAFVAGAALTIDQAPKARLSQAIGYFGITMLSMNAVAPIVVEAIAARHGFAPAFATAAAGAGLCAGVSLTLPSRPVRNIAREPSTSLLDVARRPAQLRSGVVIALVGSCFVSLFVFGQLQALAVGLPDVYRLFAAYAVAAVVARVGLGHIGDRYGRLRVSAAMLVLYAGGAIGLTQLGRIGLVPIGLLFGLAHGLFYPTYNASVIDGAPESERGRIVALFQGFFNAGMAAGSLGFGWLAEVQSLRAVFVAASLGIIAALGIVVSGALSARRERQPINRVVPGHIP